MKLIFLATSEARRNLLTSSLYGLGLRSVRQVNTWDALMQGLVSDRPDLVLIEYDAIAGGGEQALASADWALRAMKIPTVIALPPEAHEARTQLELSTEFEHFLVAPYDQDQMAATISDAVGNDGWLTATGEVATLDLGFFTEEPPTDRSILTRPTASVPVVQETEPHAWHADERAEFGGESTEPRRTTPVPESDPDEQATVPIPMFGELRPPLVPDPPADEVAQPAAPPSVATTPTPAAVLRRTGPRTPIPMGTGGPLTGTASSEPVVGHPAPSGAEPDAQRPLDVDSILPPVEAGELGAVTVASLLHALSVLGATGRLRLAQATLRREVLIVNGTPGRDDISTTAVESARLLGTFAWTEGTWLFLPERTVPVTFAPFCHALEFIYRGIEAQVSMNDLARLLGRHFRQYPVWTNRMERIREVRYLDRVASIVSAFDGQTTFEQKMMQLGLPPEEVLRASYFGLITGLLAFGPTPSAAPAQVRYVPTVYGAPPPMPEGAARLTDTGGGGAKGARAQSTRVTSTGQGQSVDAVEQDTIRRLQAVVDSMQVADAYGVLGVAPGCGVERINERYYELVRDYHPDRFSRNPQSPARNLAEKIFLLVRNATAEARRHEAGGFARPSSAPRMAQGAAAGGSEAVSHATPPAGTPGRQKVADVLERLRRNSGSHQAAVATSPSGSQPAVGSVPAAGGFGGRDQRSSLTRTQVGTMTPEQLVRNARKLIENSVFEKAGEVLATARSRGAGGAPIDGLDEYIAYATDRRPAKLVLKNLEDIIEQAPDDVEKARLLVLRAHVLRMTGEEADALKVYTTATRLDAANDEAQRWVRHLKMKQTKKPQSESLLDKLRNTKITLPGSKPK